MSKKVRVLYVNGGLMDRGGVSSVMMNYYMHIDSSQVQIDFLTHGYGEGIRDKEIINNGGKIFTVPPKSKNYFKNTKMIRNILKKNHYDIVHSHADAGNVHILKIAKQCGVPVRISHSHNTDYTINNPVRKKLADMQKKNISKYATHMFACSEEAAMWLYGKSVSIIKNAIEINNYSYNEVHRNKIRNKYNIGDSLLVGCVGRLDYQKNQTFLLKVFSDVVKRRDDICLMLLGDGILKNELTEETKRLKIEDRVIFAGQVSNVNEYYSAFDIMVMPSLFEGFPVALVEAQCSNLPCLVSDNVTDSVKINSNMDFLSLSNYQEWVEQLSLAYPEERTHSGCLERVKSAGYDINIEAKKLEQFYLKVSENYNESFDN